jgi:hypothetical protein
VLPANRTVVEEHLDQQPEAPEQGQETAQTLACSVETLTQLRPGA